MSCWECKYLAPSNSNHGLNGLKYYWCSVNKIDAIESVCRNNGCEYWEPKASVGVKGDV